MADMFEYLAWRGDLSFLHVPPCPVDALILSALVYCDFAGILPEDGAAPVALQDAAEAFLALPDPETRVRVKNDLRLLEAAAAGISGWASTGVFSSQRQIPSLPPWRLFSPTARCFWCSGVQTTPSPAGKRTST